MKKNQILVLAMAVITLFTATIAYAERSGGVIGTDVQSPVKNQNYSNGLYTTGGGGALYNDIVEAEIVNTVFNTNTAKNGGAVYNALTMAIDNGTFTSNVAQVGDGGAIKVNSPNSSYITTIKNSSFTNNSALSYTNSDGGAISLTKGKLVVDNSTFTGNKAGEGGAIEQWTSDNYMEISNSAFENNEANGFGALAIFGKGGTTTITDSTFTANHANKTTVLSASSMGGGAIGTGSDAKIIVSGSTFENNTASIEGGAIDTRHFSAGDNTGAKLDIVNSIFTGNKSGVDYNVSTGETTASAYASEHGKGGAINNNLYNSVNRAGSVYVSGSTFDSNSAVKGGAIYNNVSQSGDANQGQIGNMYIQGSTFTGNTATKGGAIYNEGTMTIVDSVFTNNSATGQSGAIHQDSTSAKLTLNNVTFDSNNGDWGGAIVARGVVDVTGGSFESNYSNDGGGAIYLATLANKGHKLSIDGTTFTGNYTLGTTVDGGGAIGSFSDLTIANAKFTSNEARGEGDGGAGGAIIMGSVSTNSVSNTEFKQNKAATHGGAIATRSYALGDNHAATLDITDSSFTGNTAVTTGGAIDNSFYNSATRAGSVYVENSTFTTNSAVQGGAIYNHRGSGDDVKVNSEHQVGNMYIQGSTFTGNTASGSGGAIYNEGTMTVGGNFNENSAYKKGGAIYNEGSLTITNASSFTGNTTTWNGAAGSGPEDVNSNGGAIWNSGTLTIGNDVTFLNNHASNLTSSGNGHGSDLYNYGGTVQIGNNLSVSRDENFNPDPYKHDCAMFIVGGSLTIGENANFTNISEGIVLASNATLSIGNGLQIIDVTNGIDNWGSGNVTIGANTIFDGTRLRFLTNEDTYATKITIGGNAVFRNALSSTFGSIYNGNSNTIEFLGSSEFTNNKAYGNNAGVFQNYSGTLKFDGNAIFSGNMANGVAGALRNRNAISSTTFEGDATFINNAATGNAGAIINEGTLIFNGKSTFIGNIAGGQVDYIEDENGLWYDPDTSKHYTWTLNGVDTTTSKNGGAIHNTGTLIFNDTATFTGNTASGSGGAIYNAGAMTVIGSTFTNNTASGDGGAIQIDANGLQTIVQDSTFTGNTALGYAKADSGAVSIIKGIVNISGSTFKDNEANVAGALYAYLGTKNAGDYTKVMISNSSFTGNKANGSHETTSGGGAIVNMASSVRNGGDAGMWISDTSFTGNKNTVANNTGGGAIFVGSESRTNISGSQFTENESASAGGAIGMRRFQDGGNEQGILDITGTTFTSNTAVTTGGAIDNYFYGSDTRDGSVYVADSTFTTNSAAQGGAIYNHAGTADQVKVGGNPQVANIYITNSTFTGNTATQHGGAIYNEGTITIGDGAEFKENSAIAGGAIYNAAGGSIAIGNNAVFKDNTSRSGSAGNPYGGSDIKNYGTVTIGDGLQIIRTEYKDALYTDHYDTGIYGMSGSSIEIGNNALFKNIAQAINADSAGTYTIGNNAIFEHNGSVITNFGSSHTIGSGAIFRESQFAVLYNHKADGSITVGNNALFENNRGDAGYTSGNGSIANNKVSGASMTFGDGMVARNNTTPGKGIIYNASGSTMSVGKNATFTGNSANNGGVIYNLGTMTVGDGAEFVSNSSVAGGAIYNTGNITLSDVNMRDNTATNNGGAVYNADGATFTVNATNDNATFAGNKVGTTGNYTANDIYNAGTVNLNAANGKTIYVQSGISGSTGILNINNADGKTGVVDVSGNITNQTVTVYRGELALSNGAADGSNLGTDADVSYVTAYSGTTINTIDATINNYASKITLNDGANVKLDSSLALGSEVDTFNIAPEKTVTVTGLKVISDVANINDARTLTVSPNEAGKGNINIDTNLKVYTSKWLYTVTGNNTNDGTINIEATGEGGINTAVAETTTEAPKKVTYTLTDNETYKVSATPEATTVQKAEFVIEGNDKTLTAAAGASGIKVDENSTMTVSNLTLEGFSDTNEATGGAIVNYGTLYIKDAKFAASNGIAIIDYGNLYSDPTDYHSHTSKYSGTSVYEGDSFSGISYSGNGAAYFNSSTSDGVTITSLTEGSNYYAPKFYDNTTTQSGGAIYNSGTMTVSNALFGIVDDSDPENPVDRVNSATLDGGAVYNTGTMTITDSNFYANRAGGKGGAIYNATTSSRTLNINAVNSDVVFSSNKANYVDETHFDSNDIYNTTKLNLNADATRKITLNGGITGDSESKGTLGINTASTNTGSVTIANTLQNQTTTISYGTLNLADDTDVTGSSFTINANATMNSGEDIEYTSKIINKGTATFASGDSFSVAASSVYGGAIDNQSGANMEITGATVSNNTASSNGGAINNAGTLTISGSTFTGNTSNGTASNQGGGAIYNTGTLTVTDTSFTNNTSAKYGGAIYSNKDVTINALNSPVVFSGNTATDKGNDIYVSGATLYLNSKDNTNSIALTDINGSNYNISVNNAEGYTGTVALGDVANVTNLTIVKGSATAETIGLTYSGVLAVNGGSLTLSEANDIRTINILENAKLTTNASLTVSAGENSGTIDGTGTLSVKSYGSYTNSGLIKNAISVLANGTLTTAGANATSDATSGITGTVANAGTLNITGGYILSDITGAGTTYIKGAVTSNAAISTPINIYSTNSLSIAPNNIGNTVSNANGTLTLTGGTAVSPLALGYAVSGAGSTVIDGFVTNNSKIANAITINSGKKLTTEASDNIYASSATKGIVGTVANAGTLEITAGTVVANITGDSGSLSTADGVGIKSGVSVTQGNLTVAGTLTNAGTLTVKNSLTNNGTIANNNSLYIDGGTAVAPFTNAGTINGSGTTYINSGKYFTTSAIANAINNAGTLTLTGGTVTKAISGTGSTVIDGDVTASANISNSAGITILAATTADASVSSRLAIDPDNIKVAVANEGRLLLNADGTLAYNVTGDGSMVVDANVTNNVAIINNPITINGGKKLSTTGIVRSGETITKGFTGTVANAGTLAVTAGAIENTVTGDSGTLQTSNGVSIKTGTSVTQGTVDVTGTLTNAGDLTVKTAVSGSSTPTIDNDGTLTLQGGTELAPITVAADITGDGSTVIDGVVSASKSISNADGISILSATASTSGDASQLTISTGYIDTDIANDGTLKLTGGGPLLPTALNNNITGSGTTIIEGGVTSSASITNNNITINSGKLLVNEGTVTVKNALTNGGTITNNGSLYIDGGTAVVPVTNAGMIDGTGTTYINSGKYFSTSAAVRSGTTLTAGITNAISNAGTLTLTGGTVEGAVSGLGTTIINGTVVNSSTIANAITISGGSLTSAANTLTGAITNNVANGLVLTGGANANAITGTGSTVIDGTVSSTASIGSTGGIKVLASTTAVPEAKSQLTIGATNVGANVTNDGNVVLNAGTLSKSISGTDVDSTGVVDIQAGAGNSVTTASGAGFANNTIKLTSGTLDASGLANASGNVTFATTTPLIANGGRLSVIDGKTGAIALGAVDTTAANLNIGINVNYATGDADVLSLTSFTGTNKIVVDAITALAVPVATEFEVLIADSSARGYVTLDDGVLNYAPGSGLGNFLLGYGADTGIITGKHSDLTNAVISTLTTKVYNMKSSSSIAPLTMGGSSLTVNIANDATGSTISATSAGANGITLGAGVDNQSLTLNGVTISNFGTAIINGAKGTLTLNGVTVSEGTAGALNTISNANLLILNGINTLNSAITGDGDISLLGGTTTNNGTIAQDQITIAGGKLITSASNVTATGGILNNTAEGIEFTGGANANVITGTGSTVIDGTVSSTAAISNSGGITIKSATTAAPAVAAQLTIGASNVGTTVTNNGTLVLNAGTLAAASTVSGSGVTKIDGTVTSNASIDNDITILATVTGGSTPAQLTIGAGNVDGAVTNYGKLFLNAGTLENAVSGSGTTTIQGAVINSSTLASTGGITISSGSLTSAANTLTGAIVNNVAEGLVLTGGANSNTITGTGSTVIDGTVSSTALIGSTGGIKVLASTTAVPANKSQLTIGATNVGAAVTNNGTLVLQTGTLSRSVSGSGSTTIDGVVRSNAAINSTAGTITVNSTITGSDPAAQAQLSIDAANVGAAVTNNGLLTLTGGTAESPSALSKAVSGTGSTVIDGVVSSSALISNSAGITINGTITGSSPAAKAQLTIDPDNIGVAVANSGILTLNADGTLAYNVTGNGSMVVDADVTNNVAIINNPITINGGKKLSTTGIVRSGETITKGFTGTVANAGTLAVTAGAIENTVTGDSGTLQTADGVSIKSGTSVTQGTVNVTGTLSNAGALTVKTALTGSSTPTIDNDGTLTLQGGTTLAPITVGTAIIGDGATTISGVVVNNSTITQSTGGITISSGSLTSAANTLTGAITNNVANGLVLTGGANANAITGTGSTKIDAGVNTVTNSVQISQSVNVASGTLTNNSVITGDMTLVSGTVNNTAESSDIKGNVVINGGTLTANASKIATNGASTITNDGTLQLAGGTLSKAVNKVSTAGAGTVDIAAGTGTVNMNAAVTDNKIQLSSGTLNVVGLEDTGSIDLSTATSIVAKGGTLNVSGDSKTSAVNLGVVNTATSALNINIDANFNTKAIDTLSATGYTPSNGIVVSSITSLADPTTSEFTLQLTTDDDIMSSIALASDNITFGDKGKFKLEYGTTTGKISVSHYDLSNAVTSTITTKTYTMKANETIAPITMGGSSLEITGANKTISAATAGGNGITMGTAVQSLTINNATVSGFGTAITNNANGTLVLNGVTVSAGAVGALNTISNIGTMQLKGTNTLNSSITGATGTLEVVSGATTNNGAIVQSTITITGGSLTSNASNLTGAIVNNVANGLVLTGGANVNTITGTGSTVIDGTVSSTASIGSTGGIKVLASTTAVPAAKSQLTIGATNVGANVTNDGNVILNAGTLSKAISGTDGDSTGVVDIQAGALNSVTTASGAGFANNTIKLTSGTLDVTSLANSNGDVTFATTTPLVANGGRLSVVDSKTGAIELGAVNTTAANLNIGIDVNYATATVAADILTLSSITGSNKIIIDTINVVTGGEPTETYFYTTVAGASAKAYVDLSASAKIYNPTGTIGNFLISYDSTTGKLKGEHSTLGYAVTSTLGTKLYNMKENETIAASTMGGNSLSVTGNSKTISAATAGGNGITLGTGENNQSLTLNGVTISNFGTAITNGTKGTLVLDGVTVSAGAVGALNTISNTGTMQLKGTNTLNSSIAGATGTLEVVNGTTTNNGKISQSSVTVDLGATLTTIGVDDVTNPTVGVTSTIANAGTLNVTGGTIVAAVTGAGAMHVQGAVTSNAAIENAMTIDGANSLTIAASNVGNTVSNAGGTLTLNGGTAAAPSVLSKAVSGAGNTVIEGIVRNDSSIVQTNLTISSGHQLITNAANVTAAIHNNGSNGLVFTGGTNNNTVDGTGSTVINGVVTSGASIASTGGLIINSTITGSNPAAPAQLTIGANNVGAAVTNNGKLILTGSNVTLSKNINGSGLTDIQGTVSINNSNHIYATGGVTITSGSLTTYASNIHSAIVNNVAEGLVLTGGGTLVAISGTGSTVIDGTVTNNHTITTALIINSGKTLTTSAAVRGVNNELTGGITNTVANSGILKLTGGTVESAISGTGKTEIRGIVLNNSTITQTTNGISIETGGKLTSAADTLFGAITNKVANGLVLTGGANANAITGTGSTKIDAGTNTVTNNAVISQAVNVESGTLANASTISGAVNVESNAIVNNYKIVDDVTTNGTIQGSVANKGTLTTNASNIATGTTSTITNEGTLRLSGGTLSKDVNLIDSGNGVVEVIGDTLISSTIANNKLLLTEGKAQIGSTAILSSAVIEQGTAGIFDLTGGGDGVNDITVSSVLGNVSTYIDIDLVNLDADTIFSTNVSTGTIKLDKVVLTSDAGSKIPEDIRVTDNNVEATIGSAVITGLDAASDSIGGMTLSIVHKDDGYYVHFEHSDLISAIKSTVVDKAYVLKDTDTPIALDLGTMGGTNLSISGSTAAPTLDGGTYDGILVASGQSLTFGNVTLSNFGTVADNAAGGTLILNGVTVSVATATSDNAITNAGTMQLKGANTLNSSITGGGTLEVVDGTTTNNGRIAQASVTIDEGATLTTKAAVRDNTDALVEGLAVTGTIANAGTLNLTGGNLENAITGAGTTYIKGVVTSDAAIANAIIIDTTNSLKINADNIGGGVTNVAGTLTLTGGELIKDVTGAGTTVIDGALTNSALIENAVTINSGKSLTTSGVDDTTAPTVGVAGAIANAGTLNITGGTIVSAVTGDGATTISGVVVNNSKITQSTGGITISSGSLTSNASDLTGAITNNVANGLVLTGGTNANTIGGTGSTQIDAATGVVINTAALNQDVNVATGTLNNTGTISGSLAMAADTTVRTNAATIATAGTSTITSDGTLQLTGGTLTKAVNKSATAGAGTVEIAAGEGNSVVISANINDNNIKLTSGTMDITGLAGDSGIDLSSATSLTSNGGAITTRNNAFEEAKLGNLILNSDVDYKVDMDLLGEKIDTIAVDSVTNTSDKSLNIVVDVPNNIKIPTTKTTFKISPISDSITDPTLRSKLSSSVSMKGLHSVISPIYKYSGKYDPETGMLTFGLQGAGRGDWKSYNPSILSAPIAAQTGGYLTQLNSYEQAFMNMDMYMLMNQEQRNALKYANKIAEAVQSNTTIPYDSSAIDNNAAGLWFRPYASYENVHLHNGPRVHNAMYGTFFGGDSKLIELSRGWDAMFTGYIGYNGSHQSYNGVSMYQNGGTIGATAMAFKNNFFAGVTANVGSNLAEASTMYGSDDIALLMAGAALRTGYNFEFFKGKFIIQPSMTVSYTFVDTFNYRAKSGARIHSDPLHAINIQPGFKFIGNFKNGWQPYAGIYLVWNFLDETKFTAQNVSLPEMSVKPYLRYGFGLQKKVGDRFTGFAQMYIHSIGRSGVSFALGFRWTLGKAKAKVQKAMAPIVVK